MIVKRPPRLTNREYYLKYIESDLYSWLKEINVAFSKINFEENFQAFIVSDVSIPAGQQVAIPNQFAQQYPGIIPTGRIIIRQTGNANIIDGNLAWTSDLLFLQNPSANDAVVSVLFFI